MAMDSSESESVALGAAVLLSQASALLARAGGRVLSPWNVTWPQALSLLVLADQGAPISATRLVEYLGLGRTAMTSVVDRLERNGWVERRPSPVDRRTADLVLTDAGRSLVENIRPVLRDLANAYFAGFRPRDLERFANDLNRLRSSHPGRL
jgi:MarR family transcriptional regulator, transcriptional regulator for hemolysin